MDRLLLDIGNTKTALAAVENEQMVGKKTFPSQRDWAASELSNIINNLINAPEQYSEIWISSVIPQLIQNFHGQTHLGTFALKWIDRHMPKSFEIDIEQPETLGPDRIADAEAIMRDYGPGSIVIDLGTASTVSVLDKDGVFRGGLIAPGLGISQEALLSKAAALHAETMLIPSTWIGKNTQQALAIGVLKAHVQMIVGSVVQMEKELGYVCQKIVTGGALSQLKGEFEALENYQLDMDLTLKGVMYLSQNSRDRHLNSELV